MWGWGPRGGPIPRALTRNIVHQDFKEAGAEDDGQVQVLGQEDAVGYRFVSKVLFERRRDTEGRRPSASPPPAGLVRAGHPDQSGRWITGVFSTCVQDGVGCEGCFRPDVLAIIATAGTNDVGLKFVEGHGKRAGVIALPLESSTRF